MGPLVFLRRFVAVIPLLAAIQQIRNQIADFAGREREQQSGWHEGHGDFLPCHHVCLENGKLLSNRIDVSLRLAFLAEK